MVGVPKARAKADVASSQGPPPAKLASGEAQQRSTCEGEQRARPGLHKSPCSAQPLCLVMVGLVMVERGLVPKNTAWESTRPKYTTRESTRPKNTTWESTRPHMPGCGWLMVVGDWEKACDWRLSLIARVPHARVASAVTLNRGASPSPERYLQYANNCCDSPVSNTMRHRLWGNPCDHTRQAVGVALNLAPPRARRRRTQDRLWG